MDPNVEEENIDSSKNIVQKIIINNFEIKSNNFLNRQLSEQNDTTMKAVLENYQDEDEKNMQNTSSDFTKLIEEETIYDIIKDSKCFISCKICNNILALEGITYSKLK
jgi:hypothetical protein